MSPPKETILTPTPAFRIGLLKCVWWYFHWCLSINLHLDYSYVQWVIQMDKCDFLFLTHTKDAAVEHTATDSGHLLTKNSLGVRKCLSVWH